MPCSQNILYFSTLLRYITYLNNLCIYLSIVANNYLVLQNMMDQFLNKYFDGRLKTALEWAIRPNNIPTVIGQSNFISRTHTLKLMKISCTVKWHGLINLIIHAFNRRKEVLNNRFRCRKSIGPLDLNHDH